MNFNTKSSNLKIKQGVEIIELLNDFLLGKIAWSKYDEKSTQMDINWKNKALPEETKKKKKHKNAKPIKRRPGSRSWMNARPWWNSGTNSKNR